MNLFDDADEFFRRRRRTSSHVGPLLIVSSLAVLEFVQHVFIEVAVASQMGAGRNAFLFAPLSLFVHLYVLALPFAIWILYAVAFHVLSGILGGEGTFRRTVVLTGWGFLPRVPVKLLSVTATWFVIERVPEPQLGATYSYLVQLQNHWLLAIPTAVGLVATVWALPDILWVYAVKHARNLERWQAIVAVNVPVGISILLTANDFLHLI